MSAAGVVSGVLFLIPVMIIPINLLGVPARRLTERRCPRALLSGFFISVSMPCSLLGVVTALSAWPDISGALRFTGVTEAKTQLWLLRRHFVSALLACFMRPFLNCLAANAGVRPCRNAIIC